MRQLLQQIFFRIKSDVPKNLFPLFVKKDLYRNRTDTESGPEDRRFPDMSEHNIELFRKVLFDPLDDGLHHVTWTATRSPEFNQGRLALHAGLVHRVVPGRFRLLFHPVPVDANIRSFAQVLNTALPPECMLKIQRFPHPQQHSILE
jgi:hypothetical protein